MNRLHVALVSLGVLAGTASSALAVPHGAIAESILRTPLQCQILSGKVIAITNSTGATISGGTQISYDVIRMPDHAHIGGQFVSSTMPPGATVKRGLFPAYSCTAWFRKPLVLAPP